MISSRPCPAGSRGHRCSTQCSAASTLLGVSLFFTPGLAGLAYAYYKGRGNLSDGLSKLLDEVSAGYFQPNVGGANIPVSEGALSDLAGDQPLFKALYQWWVPLLDACSATCWGQGRHQPGAPAEL